MWRERKIVLFSGTEVKSQLQDKESTRIVADAKVPLIHFSPSCDKTHIRKERQISYDGINSGKSSENLILFSFRSTGNQVTRNEDRKMVALLRLSGLQNKI
jgi:hypothetical protein